MKFIDAHCHLEHELFDADLTETLLRNKEKVEFVINCGGRLVDNLKILKIHSSNNDFLYSIIGIAPHFYSESFQELEKQVKQHFNEIIGLGEIGLDLHHFSRETLENQKKVFINQLNLAEELSLPVVIHSRNAEKECIEILNSYNLKVQMHCFFKHSLLNSINFEHIISVPTLKSKDCDKTIEKTSVENLVFETDSPFLWSENGKFIRNEPKNVQHVYLKCSEMKKVPLEDLKEIVKANLNRIFKLIA